MELFGIRFVGINPENGQKLLVTVCFIVAVGLLRILLRRLANLILGGNPMARPRFWTHQGISLFTTLVLMLVILSIWFDDPTRLTTAMVWSRQVWPLPCKRWLLRSRVISSFSTGRISAWATA